MEYLIIAFLIFFMIDVYYRLRKTNENIFLLRNVALLVVRYEKLLLKEKIITESDIAFTRKIMHDQNNSKDFQKLKNIFVSLDPDYMDVGVNIITQAPIGNKNWINQKEQNLRDILFFKQYRKLKMFMQDVERKNITEFQKDPDKWVEDKYGKELFNEK